MCYNDYGFCIRHLAEDDLFRGSLKREMDMDIIKISKDNYNQFGSLVADFRVALKSYKGIKALPDAEAGESEMKEYIDSDFPCYAAVCDGESVGYIVCRVDAPCVWVESIYAKPEFRRIGVATQLFEKAEELAKSFGEDTVFNYVHPNNHGMIAFLRKHGYTVINLVEIRKPYKDEQLTQTIQVGEHAFDY